MNELHSAVSKSVFLFINNTMTWQVFFLPLGPSGSGAFARTARSRAHNYYGDEGAQFETPASPPFSGGVLHHYSFLPIKVEKEKKC